MATTGFKFVLFVHGFTNYTRPICHKQPVNERGVKETFTRIVLGPMKVTRELEQVRK